MNETANDTALKVCFVRPDAIRLFEPSAAGEIGGAQVRSYTFAKALARRPGYQVSFLIDIDDRRNPRAYDGVTVYFRPKREYPRTSELLRQRASHWKLAASMRHRLIRSARKRLGLPAGEMVRLLNRINADVYCCFGVGRTSADVIQAARYEGARSVLFLVHDRDVGDDYPAAVAVSESARKKMLRARDFAIASADEIVAQSKEQQQRLTSRFERRCPLLNNPIDLAVEWPRSILSTSERFVLWIGRADTFHKRADRLLELASRCPEVQFVAVMNRFVGDSFEMLAADAPDNVRIVEDVPFEEIDSYFTTASLLINTSDAEGFPNTFLQAAKYKVPIVSYCVDPNGVLSQHDCGLLAESNLDRMAEFVKGLWSDPVKGERIGQLGRRYVERFHSLQDRADDLARMLGRICVAKPPLRSAWIKTPARNGICGQQTFD